MRQTTQESLQKIMTFLGGFPDEGFPVPKNIPAQTLGRERKSILEVSGSSFLLSFVHITYLISGTLQKQRSNSTQESGSDNSATISRNSSTNSIRAVESPVEKKVVLVDTPKTKVAGISAPKLPKPVETRPTKHEEPEVPAFGFPLPHNPRT